METRKNVFSEFMNSVDDIIATRAWVKDLLVLNMVSPSKIHLLNQGLCRHYKNDQIQPRENNGAMRLVYMGRADKTKGLDVFIKAFKQVEDDKMIFDIYGVEQDNSKYFRKIKDLAASDKRITIKATVQGKEVIKTLALYDMLVVPSQCMETGPMVALEAFAAGVPVIGSRLGGIAELVEDEVNGMLVDPFLQEAWIKALQKLSRDRDIVAKFKANVTPPKDMTEVARKMVEIYSKRGK